MYEEMPQTRGPGRRSTRNQNPNYGDHFGNDMNDISSGQPIGHGGSASFMHGPGAMAQQSGPKFPTSIDIKFDINNSESILKAHALKQY